MLTLEEIEARKARRMLLFASSRACAPAIAERLARDRTDLVQLVLLEAGSGLSPRRTDEQKLADLVLGSDWRRGPSVRKWPESLECVRVSSALDPALLASTSRIEWFFDSGAAIEPLPGSADYACAVNVALGALYGIPWSCFDDRGRARPSPFSGPFGSCIVDALARELERRRRFTEDVRLEGLVLYPDCCEPALWSGQGGGISAGSLDLPLDVIWRLRRLEMFVDEMPVETAWPEEANAVAEAEKEICAALVRSALNTKVSLEWAFPPK